MGITGLLPLLKSIQRNCHIREWAGRTVGVDAYGWLHKGTISCAVDLALGKPTTKYVDYVMNRVKMLHHFGVIPYLVFDGDYLPSKAGTEADRERKRAQSRATGLELLKLERTSLAYLELQKSIDVNPTMARHIIDACNAIGVKCLVAPYEADSQLYYLEKMGVVDAIVSEDSDLLVFGVKSLITKLDNVGECIEINRDRFTACKDVSLAGWTQTEFRHMCILSGCDYLENIPSMGLKTAHRMMSRHRDAGRVVRQLQLEGKKPVPRGYLEAFKLADMTFQHQRVFCPNLDRIVMANDPEPGVTIDDEILLYIGPEVEAEIARRVARGDLDPITKEPIAVAKSSPAPQRAKPSTPAKRGLTIQSFFKVGPSSQPALARTPLQPRNVNQLAAYSSVSAPAKPPHAPIPLKRPLPDAVASEPKKPRIAMLQQKADARAVPQTAERSPFFAKQSRRTVETPTPKIRPAPTAKHSTARPSRPDGSSDTAAPERSPPSPAKLPVAIVDSVDKPARGWKEMYGFSPARTGDRKLSDIIHKQRLGQAPRRLSSLQHLGAKALGSPRRSSATLPQPLLRREPSTKTDSDPGSQKNGNPSSSSSSSSSSSTGCSQDSDRAVCRGMFDKFAYHKQR